MGGRDWGSFLSWALLPRLLRGLPLAILQASYEQGEGVRGHHSQTLLLLWAPAFGRDLCHVWFCASRDSRPVCVCVCAHAHVSTHTAHVRIRQASPRCVSGLCWRQVHCYSFVVDPPPPPALGEFLAVVSLPATLCVRPLLLLASVFQLPVLAPSVV